MGTETTIATQLDGTISAGRQAARESFAGHQMSTPWDSAPSRVFQRRSERGADSFNEERRWPNEERNCARARAMA